MGYFTVSKANIKASDLVAVPCSMKQLNAGGHSCDEPKNNIIRKTLRSNPEVTKLDTLHSLAAQGDSVFENQKED